MEKQLVTIHKSIIFLLIFFLSITSYSQSQLLEFKIVDSQTAQPIQYCFTVVKGKNENSISNDKGEIKIKVVLNDTLIISQLGYFTTYISLADILKLNGIVKIKAKNYNLDEVIIKSTKLDTFQPKTLTTVLDFNFYDDLLIVLANKNEKYNTLQVFDLQGNLIAERKLKIKSEALIKDCFENIHIANKDSVYQVYYNYEELLIYKPYSKRTFNEILAPCECVYGEHLVFKVKEYRKLKNSYFLYANKKRKTIASIADSMAIKEFKMD